MATPLSLDRRSMLALSMVSGALVAFGPLLMIPSAHARVHCGVEHGPVALSPVGVSPDGSIYVARTRAQRMHRRLWLRGSEPAPSMGRYSTRHSGVGTNGKPSAAVFFMS